MQKLRILGPRARLGEVVRVLQDLGLVHLCEIDRTRCAPVLHTPRERRRVRALRRALEDVQESLARLPEPGDADAAPAAAPSTDAARSARLARRARRAIEHLSARRSALDEERASLVRFQQFYAAFEALPDTGGLRSARTYHLVLPPGDEEAEAALVRGLEDAIGRGFVLQRAKMESGDVALALVVSDAAGERLEAQLERSGIRDLQIPARYGASLREAMPGIEARLRELEAELRAVAREREQLTAAQRPALLAARALLQDGLAALEAMRLAGETPRAFVLEGWLPHASLRSFARRLGEAAGPDVVVEPLASEAWAGEDAPVELSNPRLFQPFETLTRVLPLPVYGSIDPTPFVAIFFPMFFGLILGDVGYGAMLGVAAGLLRLRSRPRSGLRAAAEIAGACAAFTIVFGLLYGELFGDFGQHSLGLRPLAFAREEALVPFLALAVALGFVHVLLGLVLGALASLGSEPRRSVGRGLAALMLLLVAAALLAALNVLPAAFFTPAIVALLVAFPLLCAIEGVIGPIEFLSTLSNVLSYARIMAVGTASVMMAVAANQLVGAFGGAVVGVLFALLFHLVNFVLGVFSPTIHALRLHYVEFFGKFHSPGGLEYRPLRHWRPGDAAAA